MCLHNSFCRNRESIVDPLPCCKQMAEEQKCWRTTSNSFRIAKDVLQDTETESAESMSQERRWSIDKWPEDKMKKETKLEIRQRKKQRSDEKKKLKLRIVLCV